MTHKRGHPLTEGDLTELGLSEEQSRAFLAAEKDGRSAEAKRTLRHRRSELLAEIHRRQSNLGKIDYILKDM